MRAGAALALLAALAATAFLASRWYVVAALAVALLAVCLRAPARRRWPYLVGTAVSALGVFLLTPLVGNYGLHTLWAGPTIPVLGRLDVTSEELASGAVQALRLAAVGFAFAAYALFLDHDRLLQGVRVARRSAIMVALATRLVPTLERDAGGLVEALRGRGIEVAGVRGHARLLSPLLAGSLERGYALAEAMESRGYGSAGGTRAPSPAWTTLDWAVLAAAAVLVTAGALWL